MVDLLLHFDSLFAEPTDLRSHHAQSYEIQLLPGMTLIVVQPYHYSHAQNVELERQCVKMLQLGTVRPSSSAISALVVGTHKTPILCTNMLSKYMK
jgi:hypothetical protein